MVNAELLNVADALLRVEALLRLTAMQPDPATFAVALAGPVRELAAGDLPHRIGYANRAADRSADAAAVCELTALAGRGRPLGGGGRNPQGVAM